MAIKLLQQKNLPSEYSNLAAVRKSILAAAKAAQRAGRHDCIEITLPEGKHTLKEPLVLSAKENPELASVDITLRSRVPGGAEINSLVRLPGREFVQAEGKDYFTYQFPKKKGAYPAFHDFFLNFKRIPMARSEMFYNLDPLTDEERDGKVKREGFWAPMEIAEKIAQNELGATELVMYIEWVFAIFHVAKVDLTKTRTEGGVTYALVVLKDGEMDDFCTTFVRHLNIGKREMFFQNAPAFLTENTFAYDYFRGLLYLNPENPAYMYCHAPEYPALETLIELDGIENFTVDGVVFSGTTCGHTCRGVYRCGQANNNYALPDMRVRAAAIFTRDVRNLTVTNCSFRHLGGNGILSVDRSVGTTVTNSRFLDVSMSAIVVGNPTWKWEEERNRTFALHIENNYFRHIGYDYPASVCIYVGEVDGLSILHNTIHGCAYSGMSVGWGWGTVAYELGEKVNVRDAEIAYNRIHNFMDLLRDGGAIYVLGGNCHPSNSRRFNLMHDNYAELDDRGKGGKIGYYCDGSSSNWEMYHSVVVNCPFPLFSQSTVVSQFTHHNHIHDNYITDPFWKASHAPYRDTLFFDIHVVEEGKEALFEKYPVAQEIRDAAGCNLCI